MGTRETEGRELTAPLNRPCVSESRIKRITRIARITPHIPTAASSFPCTVSFASPAAIETYPPGPRYSLRSL